MTITPDGAVRVGLFPLDILTGGAEAAAAALAEIAHAGFDHVCCGDHVSFFNGAGFGRASGRHSGR
jgi:hypothetical protein